MFSTWTVIETDLLQRTVLLRFLLLNQCFYPDVVSTAQHLTDLAKELCARGHEVTVLASDRGYDSPENRFKRRERWNNIDIIRIPSLSFGKQSKFRRTLNFASYLAVCSLRLLTLRRFDVVVALTSPPLISFLGSLHVAIKGGRFCFWVMDLNPDEAIAAGWLREESLSTRILNRLLNHSLRAADRVIVLDRFMESRILQKGIDASKVSIVPPWSHDDVVTYDEKGRHSFRSRQGLEEKFVVMYSGNHSPCHPLDTVLEAARRLQHRHEIAFCFVGGGSEQAKVRTFADRHRLTNITCLPYQPINQLSSSLSAADLHLVVMGEQFVGIVHPCKIYNIMKVGTPTVYVGPRESHVVDIASEFPSDQICVAQHGDAARVANWISEKATSQANNFARISPTLTTRFSRTQLLPQLIRLIEFRDLPTRSLLETVIQDSASAQ